MVMGSLREETEVAVIGGGPGGYVAAIRAADLGREVTLIEENERLGGVCLTEGCIPSKTIIHAVELMDEARAAKKMGITFSDVKLDTRALRQWTESVVDGLTRGVSGLLKKRGVNVIHGRAVFDGPRSLRIEGSDVSGVDFRHCIIAVGSRIKEIPPAYDLPVWSSADALAIPSVPESLLVVGGGYIGLEMGTAYAGLGASVTMVEFFPRLLMGADPDLVKVVVRQAEKRFSSIQVDSKVVGIEKTPAGFAVTVEHEGSRATAEFEKVLVAVGRRPNTDRLDLEKAGVKVAPSGLIEVDDRTMTSAPGVHAVGDVTPGPMLAHKASREGKVAAEVISGEPSAFDNRAIPAVVFTDPEIAWTGLTEREAGEQDRKVNVGRFPLAALGRARSIGRTEGFVKVISEPGSGLVLGAAMVGSRASELIAEATLAIEMGATLEDLLVTIHPHPTMSEAMMEAAEVAAGSPVHVTTARG
ncbi:MAG: dihydrolipoyl dehydrogenase [Deltaproteobacteria bacterium]|nr:dihydrolipoyl dehydrogenase [Deltaproteobacteria bacterium]